MTGFFLSIVLIGIIITGVSLVMILADKSRGHDYRVDLGQKRETLVETIEDAETLVDELNRFSDYVVTRCEQTKAEIELEVQRAETIMGQLSAASTAIESNGLPVAHGSKNEPVPVSLADRPSVSGSQEKPEGMTGVRSGKAVPVPVHVPGTVRTIRKPMTVEENPDLRETAGEQRNDVAVEIEKPHPEEVSRDRGKVVDLDARRMEALRLAQKGMTHVEIAKTLHMGKGEIELIARIGSGS